MNKLLTILGLALLLPLAGCNVRTGKQAKAMEAYHAVLLNEMTFCDVSYPQNQHYTLKDKFSDWDSDYGDPPFVERFAVVDMDGDGIPEVVLQFANLQGDLAVLHYEDGTVYGFNFGYRSGLYDVKEDGIHFGSSGAADNGYYRLAFNKDKYENIALAHTASGKDANGNYVVTCYIGEKEVTEEEYELFAEQLSKKKSATWYDFTGENIASLFPSKKVGSNTPEETLADVSEGTLSNLSEESPQYNPEALRQQLTKNGEKVKKLELIVTHNGQVYSQLASGPLAERGWHSVRGYGGLAVIGNYIIYVVKNDNHTRELYRSDLQGGNETLIYSGIEYNYIWVVGDKIIFRIENEVSDDNLTFKNVFCYDPNTATTLRLSRETLDRYFVLPISFDDQYIYYAKLSTENDWRVRPDGTEDEELPFRLTRAHIVEGDDYYVIDYGEFADSPTGIGRYGIHDDRQIGDFIIEHGWLIRIENGRAYYGYENGIFAMSMSNGEVVKLADIAPGESWHGLGFDISCIIGDNLYFNTETNDVRKLYKVPLNGGEMEYQGVEWSFVAI